MTRPSFPALPRRMARGFSLIEILVVMALIGIVIALVANRIGDGAVFCGLLWFVFYGVMSRY